MMRKFSDDYLNLLKTTYQGINLTKILDPDDFYNKQIIDSIVPYEQDAIFKESLASRKILVDVGFGGGFPLLPLAKLLPEFKFVGVETRKKKVDVVSKIAHELGLKNVICVHSRLEDFLFDIPCSVTLKAVGTTLNFLPIMNYSSSVNVFFYKGPSYLELEGESHKILQNDWIIQDPRELIVPGTEKRVIVSFKNKNVPRGTSKSLVKLSEFL